MINRLDFSKPIVMQKNYLIGFLFLLCCFTVLAQDGKLKKANRLFENQAYVEAAEIYEQLEPSQEILQNLGDAYYFNFQMEKARKAYARLFDSYKDNLSKDYFYKYGHVLMGLNDYKEGDIILGEYLNVEINTGDFIEQLNKKVPYLYELQTVGGDILAGDFGLNNYGEKVVFSSVRNSENPDYKWNSQPYLDLYEATLFDNNIANVMPLPGKINSKSHESGAALTADGQTMYFARTNEKRIKIDDQKIAHVKIYKAELADDKWTNVTELPFSSDLYSVQHPVLSPDEKRLYFSSNMPGSLGSFDIYYVDISDDGFSEPVNLGAAINSMHRDQFPFITDDGDLYFSSDGHQGLGGLDIFRSKRTESGFAEPENLGETMNSGMDDFAYVLNSNEPTGYISSNRDGQDRIYGFVRKENKRTFIVEGSVRDKNSKELLPGTKVTLFNEDGSVVGEMTVGEDARYQFNTEPEKTYKIEGYKSFYIPSIEEFKTNFDGDIEYNIELEIESYEDAEEIVVEGEDGYIYIELENIYFDLDKWEIKPQAARTLDVLVGLLNKYPRMEIQLGAHTDSRNTEEYNMQLSLNRANATMQYLISNNIDPGRLTSKGYGESTPLIKCGDDCSEDEHSINRRCEFLITK